MSALTELACGRAGQGAVEGIHLGQQAHIGVGIAAAEGLGRRPAPITDPSGLDKLGDQAGQLGSRQAADPCQILPHQALVDLAQAGVAKTPELGGNPGIDRVAVRGVEAQLGTAFDESPDLLQALETFGSECHDHPPMIPEPGQPSGSLLAGNARPVQAHVSLDKAQGCAL